MLTAWYRKTKAQILTLSHHIKRWMWDIFTTRIVILQTFGELGIHSNHTPGIIFQIKLKTGECHSANSEKWTAGRLGLLLPNDGLNNATRSPLTRGCRAKTLLLRESKAVQHIIKPTSHSTTGSHAGRPYRRNTTGKCVKQLEGEEKAKARVRESSQQ